MDPDRGREHPDGAWLHGLRTLRRPHLERRGECGGVEDRGPGELQGARRLVEHKDKRVAARVRVQAGDPQRRKGRVQKQHAHVSHQCNLGMSNHAYFSPYRFDAPLCGFVSLLQHGVSAGYYLTFVLGGFVTTVARLARSTFRPLFIPVISQPSGHKSADGHGTRPSQPPASLLKTAYDVVGTICTVLVVNFITTPFILLHLSDSIEAWRRLCWYGLGMIFGTMVFFYSGGAAWLKGLQVGRVRQTNVASVSTSAPGTPGVLPTVPPLDAVFQEAEKKLS